METVEVRCGGKYLDIPADAVDRYVAKGYDVVDKSGKVIVKSIPNDYGALRAEYIKALDKIKKLESEIAELKAPKKAPAKQEVEEEVEIAAEPVDEPPVVSSSRRRSRKN